MMSSESCQLKTYTFNRKPELETGGFFCFVFLGGWGNLIALWEMQKKYNYQKKFFSEHTNWFVGKIKKTCDYRLMILKSIIDGLSKSTSKTQNK